MLELKNISKRYNYKKVLRHIHMTLPDAGMIGIVGPSGSGKTTLLNIIGGIDSQFGGELIYNGKSVKNKLHHYRRKYVSFIFQNYHLINWLTPAQNISIGQYFGSLFKGHTYNHTIEYTSDKVSSLSHGQRGYLSYLRAFFYDKDIIVADEPSGAMDFKGATELMEHLKHLSKDRLIILVSHDLSLVDLYCDEIYYVKDGYIDNHIIKNEIEYNLKNKEKTKKPIFPLIKLSLMSMLSHKKRTMQTFIALGLSMMCILCTLTLSFNLKQNIYDYIYSLVPSSSISVMSHNEIDKLDVDAIKKDININRFHMFLDNCELLGLSFDHLRYKYESTLFIHDDSSPYDDLKLKYGEYPKNNNEILISLSTARHLLNEGELSTLLNKKIYGWYKVNESCICVEYSISGITSLNTQNDVYYQKENAYVSLLKEKGIDVKSTYGLLYVKDDVNRDELVKTLEYRYKDMDFKVSGQSTIDKANDIFKKVEIVLVVLTLLIMLSSFVLIGEVTFLNIISKRKDFAVMKCFGADTIHLICIVLLESLNLVGVVSLFIIGLYYGFITLINMIFQQVMLIEGFMIKGYLSHIVIVVVGGIVFVFFSQLISIFQVIKLNTPDVLKD